jgi:hypothetical protein
MMGFDPMKDLKFIRIAHENGLSVGNPSEVEIVGEDSSYSAINDPVHDRMVVYAERLLSCRTGLWLEQFHCGRAAPAIRLAAAA